MELLSYESSLQRKAIASRHTGQQGRREVQVQNPQIELLNEKFLRAVQTALVLTQKVLLM